MGGGQLNREEFVESNKKFSTENCGKFEKMPEMSTKVNISKFEGINALKISRFKS